MTSRDTKLDRDDPSCSLTMDKSARVSVDDDESTDYFVSYRVRLPVVVRLIVFAIVCELRVIAFMCVRACVCVCVRACAMMRKLSEAVTIIFKAKQLFQITNHKPTSTNEGS